MGTTPNVWKNVVGSKVKKRSDAEHASKVLMVAMIIFFSLHDVGYMSGVKRHGDRWNGFRQTDKPQPQRGVGDLIHLPSNSHRLHLNAQRNTETRGNKFPKVNYAQRGIRIFFSFTHEASNLSIASMAILRRASRSPRISTNGIAMLDTSL